MRDNVTVTLCRCDQRYIQCRFSGFDGSNVRTWNIENSVAGQMYRWPQQGPVLTETAQGVTDSLRAR